MIDFFTGEATEPIVFFGLTHILLIVGFIISVVLLWMYLPKIKGTKYENVVRFSILALVLLFEWSVFESRMLNGSIFRLPLCAVAIYSLFYSILAKDERVFNIVYFYAFGSLLSFLFYDTPWGLDRWDGWTFFGAHATIAWLAIYGVRVLGYTPTLKDMRNSLIVLVIYSVISTYGFVRYGGSDELFVLTPPVDFLEFAVDIHITFYVTGYALAMALLVYLTYLPVQFLNKAK